MRDFSRQEKKIIDRIVSKNKENILLIDFIEIDWPVGSFEVSSFQQKVHVYLSSIREIDSVMNHLIRMLNLIKYLEKRDLISSWDQIPMEDNSQVCGTHTEESTPFFLTDISIAAELLKYANKRFMINDSLRTLATRNYRELTEWKLDRNLRIGMAGVLLILLVGIGILLTYFQLFQKGVTVSIEDIREKSTSTLDIQDKNLARLDSLLNRNKELLLNVRGISDNTQKLNKMDSLLNIQKSLILTVIRTNRNLKDEIEQNRALIIERDSISD